MTDKALLAVLRRRYCRYLLSRYPKRLVRVLAAVDSFLCAIAGAPFHVWWPPKSDEAALIQYWKHWRPVP